MPLRLGGEIQKMVREDTNHGDKENILLQIIWACPYPDESGKVGLSVTIFFEEESKKDFHYYPSCKTHRGKKC